MASVSHNPNYGPRVLVVRLGVFAVLVMLGATSGYAAPYGTGTQNDLGFYFGVNGYEANGRFGEPTALALDERNSLIYVADQAAGVIDAFSLQGIPKFQYGSKSGLKAPVGVAVDRLGNVFVSENDGGAIKVIGPKGDISVVEIPAGLGEGKEAPKPGKMTFDRDGNLYVVDRASCRILVFDKERKYKFKFGGIGDKRGEFKLLQDVALDRQGRIYATDALGVPVQVFDRKGAYMQGFGIRGEGGDGLSFPSGIFVDRHDQVWIVDKTRHCLKVYDRAGTFLKSFGSYGQAEGSLYYPVSAAADNLGRVYVLEFGARRLQVFTLDKPFQPFNPYGM
jgi:sugar lactone lactonase YvrE